MTTADELAFMRKLAIERLIEQRDLDHQVRSLHQAFHDDIYLPMLMRLISDAREKGLLPKDFL